MSEVRKGTSRNTGNENKRCKIFNKVLNMNWDYVRVKKKLKKIVYDSLVLYLTKKWLNP
jgi:hypothetical protein